MKLVLVVLIFGISLSGCAGITYYGHGDVVVSKTDFSSVSSFQDREKPPNRVPDKQYSDGTVMYVLKNEIVWCGPTIWAVIPVPLLLPLCRDHVEMIYKDGHPIQMTYQGTDFTTVAICGPGVPLLSVFGGRVGFCMFE